MKCWESREPDFWGDRRCESNPKIAPGSLSGGWFEAPFWEPRIRIRATPQIKHYPQNRQRKLLGRAPPFEQMLICRGTPYSKRTLSAGEPPKQRSLSWKKTWCHPNGTWSSGNRHPLFKLIVEDGLWFGRGVLCNLRVHATWDWWFIP